MARMIPDHRPCDTNSKGERDLYTIFKTELPDDYVVIHSLPWLCSAVNKVDPQAKPTLQLASNRSLILMRVIRLASCGEVGKKAPPGSLCMKKSPSFAPQFSQ